MEKAGLFPTGAQAEQLLTRCAHSNMAGGMKRWVGYLEIKVESDFMTPAHHTSARDDSLTPPPVIARSECDVAISSVGRVPSLNPAEQPTFGGSLVYVKIMIVSIFSRSPRRVYACINRKELPVKSMPVSTS